MPSELDVELRAIMDRLTAPGGPLETVPGERHGQVLPLIAQAQPTLPALFAHFCAQHAEREFLIDGERRFTFAETHELARRLAAALVSAHGVLPGDRVGLAARNSANWIIAQMALLMAGACATLLNGWWVGEELAEGIAVAGCKLVLADAPRAERLAGQAHAAQVVVFDHGEAGFADLLEGAGEDAVLPILSGSDLATMLFTSGSTGKCKGAVSDHLGVVQAAFSYAAQTLMVMTHLTARGIAPTGQPSALVAVPLFHVTGEVPLYLQSFVIGRKLVLMPKWDAVEAMRLIERERVTYFVGVPLMSIELAEHPRRGEFDLTSCITFAAGGAPRPVDHVARIREAMPHGFPVLGYGLTETNAVGCGNFNENYQAKPGSTGPASRPLVEVATFDDARRRLPHGETGEIGIRSICNFIGYWNDPAATAAALVDGFVLTGDVGRIDEDGYLFILDRKKDLIIRGGENIASLEVEAALYAHPAIAEASVFGLPCPIYGEVPVAVFHAKGGAQIVEADLRAFLGARLAPYKIPVRFWQEAAALPRLGTEKVDKATLRARYLSGWKAPSAR
ncbi:MAG: class I adenylate-forming enzyme family protein [Novosphingobium sp.]